MMRAGEDAPPLDARPRIKCGASVTDMKFQPATCYTTSAAPLGRAFPALAHDEVGRDQPL